MKRNWQSNDGLHVRDRKLTATIRSEVYKGFPILHYKKHRRDFQHRNLSMVSVNSKSMKKRAAIANLVRRVKM